MKRERITTDTVREPAPGLWSNCLRAGEWVFTSGMTARAADGQTILGDNEYAQAKVVFQKIKDLVEAAGGQIDDVMKMTIFVTRIAHNTQVWDARKEFFSGNFPACTLVEVRALAKAEILLEIEAIALIGSSSPD
jgi:enamine deaminase RidA (YjgF/YER057c/UK114 family)